ncbi:MAG: ABC transporter ATP-binding protein [Vicinamibacterales bacterium]
MVTVERLTKRFGRITALDAVTLEIRRGEVLGLIGPNGAGKTTLFECVAGVLPYDAGTVVVDGRAVRPGTPGSGMFYLPDAVAPWPSQRVGWVLDFVTGYFGGDAAMKAVVVERLALGPLLDWTIGTLSKGQRKRVLLAVGMLTPHPLLLADEPFDGLDLRQTREVGDALREHAAAGRTLFLSIHQITDAARVCDRFVLLSAGRVCGTGTLEELAGHLPAGAAASGAPTLEEVVLALT